MLVLACACACRKTVPQTVPPTSYALMSDFLATPDPGGRQICIDPGLAAVGNYAFPAAVGGCVTFSGGTGDAKIYLDEDGQLITSAATGIGSSAQTAQMTFQNVSLPAFPATAIPICDLTITEGAYRIDQCGMASRVRNAVIKPGFGIIHALTANGKITLSVDQASVCLTGDICDFTGTVRLPRDTGPPPSATCVADNLGAKYIDIDVGGKEYTCLRTGETSYAWTPVTGVESPLPNPTPPPAVLTGKPPIVVRDGTEVSYGFHFRSTISAETYEITPADCGYALRFNRNGAVAVSLPLLPWPCALMLTNTNTGPVNVTITQTTPDGSGGDFNGDRSFSLGRHQSTVMHVNQGASFYRGFHACRAGYCAGVP